jgi:molybdate transport system substrate-binding protein
MKNAIAITAASFVAVSMLLHAQTAGAAEIRVLSSTALKTTLDELAPQFERTTGHKIVASYGPSVRIAKRIADGEASDVVIVTPQGIEQLISQGKVVAESQTTIARSGVGLAVQKSAPKPDISSVARLKETLLAARSIAIGPGQSGAHIAKVFDQLGIAEILKPRIIIGRGGFEDWVGLYLVRGEADIAIHQMTELMGVPGINIVGPLPSEVQSITAFAVGLATSARDANVGRALINLLTTPDAIAVMRGKGFEPG